MQPHKLFVIHGRSAHYGKECHWMVCWAHSSEEAERIVTELVKQGVKWTRKMNSSGRYVPEAEAYRNKEMLDKDFYWGSDYVQYVITELTDDPTKGEFQGLSPFNIDPNAGRFGTNDNSDDPGW